MTWLACPRTSSFLLNSTRRHLSFSFRPRFPRDLTSPLRPRNAQLQSGGVPSFREQVARASPVPCFADAVRHPGIGKHIIVRQTDTRESRWRHPFIEMTVYFAVRYWRFGARLCRRCSQYQHRDELLDELPHQPEALEHGGSDYGRHAVHPSPAPAEGS